MKLRWTIVFLLIFAIGVAGIMVVSCAYNGDVTINTRDSMRFISPDLEPKVHSKVCTETTIDNDDDEEPKHEGKEK